MKDHINKIIFPVLDISINEWNLENVSEIIFYDVYFCNKSYDLFEKLRLSHKIIDSKGAIYKIIRLEKRKCNWRTFFVKSKYEMIFEVLDETVNLDDLRDLMLTRISDLEVNDYKLKWVENIKKAKNFKELIRGT
ncbi:hypothetical protein [Flavobacterium sp. C3NV]|uniref:hypothetical protein n=1 Tax=Flavobacterium sp. C3NV TaxID=3393358 RepID=UPI00398FB42E